jgi:O-antigen ligase
LGLTISLFVLILILLQKSFKKISTYSKRIISIVLIVVFSAGLILGVSFLLKSAVPGGTTYFDELVLHRTSTPEHLASITESLKTIKNNPFGSGLGTSGLVTLRFGHRSLSENWYLQIALEMGVLGLAVFIAIMVVFIRSIYRLYRDNKDNFIKGASLGILLSFICFSAVGLFLHAWGDNTVVALTFWILAGGLIEYQVLQKSN